MPVPPESPAERSDPLESLLRRPDEQRLREHKYRFSQSVVFGLPVLFLQIWGYRLGGPESQRWIAIMQALLAGWVIYVGAAGLLFEGLLLLRRKITCDFLVSALAVLLYLSSLISTSAIFATGRIAFRPLMYHLCVMLLCVWTGVQWWRWRRRISRRCLV